MWGILIEFAKPLFGFAFGTPKAIKITLIILAVTSLCGVVWWWTDNAAETTLREHKLTEANKQYAETEKSLHIALKKQAEAFTKQQELFYLASERQAQLESQISKLAEDRKNEQIVFTKKKNRYEKLLQSKGDRIIKLSNLASKRVRDKWDRETGKINRSLQEGASNLFTTSETKESETKRY